MRAQLHCPLLIALALCYLVTHVPVIFIQALDGPHSYIIADSGGLIVAVSLLEPNPQELKFSTDEGRCWHVYKFTNETIHHTGLLTEPGGKSMTVALWGYRVSDKKWTINVIDFADVITDHCEWPSPS